MRVALQPQTCGRTGEACRAVVAATAGGRHSRASSALTALGLVALVLAAALPGIPAARAQDPTLPSGGGPASSFAKTPGGLFGPKQKVDKSQPLQLQGDQLTYDSKGNRVVARGNVEIYYNNNILTADEIIYDQTAGTLTAIGNVALKDANGNVTRADRYTLTDDFRDGFVQSLQMETKDHTKLIAERASRREGNVTEFTNGRFTPCKTEGGMPPLWCVSAASVVHDQTAGTITYQDAAFEMFGQPLVYLPYFQHADPSTKRKTGFLPPSFGSSSALGYSVEIPYYVALAPSYDFTFHPRYFSKQGVLLQGDWRQKIWNGEYTVSLAGIDQGNLNFEDTNGATREARATDGFRGSLQTRGRFSLSSWWRFGWDVTLESDDTFRRFYHLDSVLQTDRVNQAYLVGQSDRNYFSTRLYHFGGLLLDSTNESESMVHPIIDYNYIFANPVLGGELGWKSNALSFSRSDAVNHSQTQSVQRAITELNWRRRMTDSIGISYTPFASLRGDVYKVDNFVDPQTGQPIKDETIARGLATGGVTVSYPWIANGPGGAHTVEPIGQVIARQGTVDQKRLPNEDAKSLVFDDTNLFEPQKFSGYDRLETGTRVNYGLQYTFQSPQGPYARVLAGQSTHLMGQNVYASPGLSPDAYNADGTVKDATAYSYSPYSGLGTRRSDYVLGAYLAPTDVFKIMSQTRFNETDFSLQREDLAAAINYGPVSASVVYTYAAANSGIGLYDTQQEITGTLGLKLTDRWSLLGSVRFDLDKGDPLTDMVQIKYADECFVLTATYTDTYITDPARDLVADRSIMLRFEWKYLGALNYKTNVLDSAVPAATSGNN